MPTALEQRLNVAPGELQRWVSILLALDAFAWLMTSPIVGYVADRVESRRKPLLAGLPVLVVSTGLLYWGDSLTLWAMGRMLQGVSAAATWTVGLALLIDTVDRERLGETLGYMSMGMMVGTTSGPLLGGILYQAAGYHSVFLAVLLLIILDTVLRLAMIEKRDASRWMDISEDLVVDSMSSQPLLSSPAVERIPNYGATGSSSDMKPCQAPRQEPDGEPREPGQDSTTKTQRTAILVLLSIPRILLSLWACFIVSIALASFDSSLPLFVHDTFGWHQLGQGLIFLPLSVTQVIDPVVGAICDRYPQACRHIIAGAFIGAAAAFVSLGIVTHDSFAQQVWLCGLLVLLGLCLSFAASPILLSIDETLRNKEEESPGVFGNGGAVALAYGLVNSSFAAGALVGPFLGGYVRSVAGWGTMTSVLGAISAITSFMMWGLSS